MTSRVKMSFGWCRETPRQFYYVATYDGFWRNMIGRNMIGVLRYYSYVEYFIFCNYILHDTPGIVSSSRDGPREDRNFKTDHPFS